MYIYLKNAWVLCAMSANCNRNTMAGVVGETVRAALHCMLAQKYNSAPFNCLFAINVNDVFTFTISNFIVLMNFQNELWQWVVNSNLRWITIKFDFKMLISYTKIMLHFTLQRKNYKYNLQYNVIFILWKLCTIYCVSQDHLCRIKNWKNLFRPTKK